MYDPFIEPCSVVGRTPVTVIVVPLTATVTPVGKPNVCNVTSPVALPPTVTVAIKLPLLMVTLEGLSVTVGVVSPLPLSTSQATIENPITATMAAIAMLRIALNKFFI